jgi:hypothetical protein
MSIHYDGAIAEILIEPDFSPELVLEGYVSSTPILEWLEGSIESVSYVEGELIFALKGSVSATSSVRGYLNQEWLVGHVSAQSGISGDTKFLFEGLTSPASSITGSLSLLGD